MKILSLVSYGCQVTTTALNPYINISKCALSTSKDHAYNRHIVGTAGIVWQRPQSPFPVVAAIGTTSLCPTLKINDFKTHFPSCASLRREILIFQPQQFSTCQLFGSGENKRKGYPLKTRQKSWDYSDTEVNWAFFTPFIMTFLKLSYFNFILRKKK